MDVQIFSLRYFTHPHSSFDKKNYYYPFSSIFY